MKGGSASYSVGNKRSGTVVYQAIGDGSETAVTALFATGIPAVYDTDGIFIVTDVSSDLVTGGDDVREFTVTVTLGLIDKKEESEDQQDPNPLSRPRQESFSFVVKDYVIDKDRDGNAIVNSTGLPFDPPLSIERGHAVWRITKNFSSFNIGIAGSFMYTVNDDTWEGFSAGTVLLVSIAADKKEESVSGTITTYYEVTGEFAINPNGWKVSVLDRGKYVTSDDPDNPRKATDEQGFEYTEPVLLDGSGNQTSTPNWLDFEIYNESDFDTLGF